MLKKQFSNRLSVSLDDGGEDGLEIAHVLLREAGHDSRVQDDQLVLAGRTVIKANQDVPWM